MFSLSAAEKRRKRKRKRSTLSYGPKNKGRNAYYPEEKRRRKMSKRFLLRKLRAKGEESEKREK